MSAYALQTDPLGWCYGVMSSPMVHTNGPCNRCWISRWTHLHGPYKLDRHDSSPDGLPLLLEPNTDTNLASDSSHTPSTHHISFQTHDETLTFDLPTISHPTCTVDIGCTTMLLPLDIAKEYGLNVQPLPQAFTMYFAARNTYSLITQRVRRSDDFV